ncbi:MAG: YbjN domain-containing protein [bacterium]|nr:YbjN domain-containing protein [bacterium]
MPENSTSGAFEKVKGFLAELDLEIVQEDAAEELVVVEDEDSGIKNLIIDCEDPILVLEQLIMEVPADPGDFFRRLLQMNRTLVHGAFAIDENINYVFFRDTLQLANLDFNELEGTIRALSLAMAEYASELLDFHRG